MITWLLARIFGAVFAHEMKERGKRVLVVEKRGHIGGNVYTENMNGLKSTPMEHISFIRTKRSFGIM